MFGKSESIVNEIACFFLVVGSPSLLAFYQISYQDFDASLSTAGYALLEEGVVGFFGKRTPRPVTVTLIAYTVYVFWQAILYVLCPGPLHAAPRTCGGRRLLYRLNGLTSWFVTMVTAAIVTSFSILDPAFIANRWGELLATANLYSLLLIAIFWVKARTIPDNQGETILTGYFWYDLFNGGELHPRTGKLFDWKHFNASRTGGILTWTLIDLSFAALQYQNYGRITNSMVLAVLFRMTVTVEYFWYENWFFETLDGSFERFSFYSIFGFGAMMPQLWTLQTQYLATHPIELSRTESVIYATLFLAGWYMRHVVDDQKSRTRASDGNCIIWGKKAKVLVAKYETADGKTHRSLLLCSGFWGIARHANYAGSFLYTLASCLICGRHNILPYTEVIIVAGMIIHRCFRDEARCRAKYGETWDEYCEIVRWRIVPGLF